MHLDQFVIDHESIRATKLTKAVTAWYPANTKASCHGGILEAQQHSPRMMAKP